MTPKSIIQTIRQLGVSESQDFWTRRVLEFNNLITAALGLLSLIYIGLFLAIGQTYLALVLTPFTLIYLLCPILNSKGYTLASRLLVAMNYLASLTVMHSISGKVLYLNLLYLVFLSRVYLIIRDDETHFRWVAVVLAASLFLLTELTAFPFLPAQNIPADTISLINQILLPTLVGVFLAIELYAYQSQRQWEQQLIEARNKAEDAAQMKSRFLSMMSHEIRTPLNGLIGTLELMDKADLKAPQQRALQTVEYASDHLCKLINNILAYNRLEAQELSLVKERVNLGELLENVIELYTPLASERQLDIELTLPRTPETPLPAFILSDETRLSEVLCNLMSNALKYTEKGKVTLKVSSESQWGHARSLRFEVIDTGIGIPKDKLDEVFNDFYQIDDAFRRKQEGTGLGLAICKNVLTLLGSELQVESQTSVGSRFWFTIDCEVPEPSTQPLNDNIESSPVHEGKRVLVVDDNQVNLSVASGFLRKLQFDVTTADSGENAIKAADNTCFDLILMDIHMPGMDGFETTEYLLAMGLNRQTPVMALTADVSILESEQFKQAGMKGLISKPFKLQQLNDTIATVL